MDNTIADRYVCHCHLGIVYRDSICKEKHTKDKYQILDNGIAEYHINDDAASR
jgi:hypothetical protein